MCLVERGNHIEKQSYAAETNISKQTPDSLVNEKHQNPKQIAEIYARRFSPSPMTTPFSSAQYAPSPSLCNKD